MARPAKPIQLILQENKYRMRKKDIEDRKKSEIHLGVRALRCPNDIKGDDIAYKKFKELSKIYKDCDYVSSSDIDAIREYCKVFSQIIKMEIALETITLTEAFDDYLKLDSRLDKKRDLFIKLQDRLFLNSASKVKSIPKKPQEDKKETPMAAMMKRIGERRRNE